MAGVFAVVMDQSLFPVLPVGLSDEYEDLPGVGGVHVGGRGVLAVGEAWCADRAAPA